MYNNKKPWYEKVYNHIAGFWKFLDGKKNKIGNAALAVYGVLETAVQINIIPEHTVVGQAALYAGLAFKIMGIGHKAVKGELDIAPGLKKKEEPKIIE